MKDFIEKIIGIESDGSMRGNVCSEAYAVWTEKEASNWTLSGSEKQIAWARSIITSKLKTMYRCMDEATWADAYKMIVEHEKSGLASWWIDHRDDWIWDFAIDQDALEKVRYDEIRVIEDETSYKIVDSVLLERAKKVYESIKK